MLVEELETEVLIYSANLSQLIFADRSRSNISRQGMHSLCENCMMDDTQWFCYCQALTLFLYDTDLKFMAQIMGQECGQG